jgi:hypothetical protein
MAGRVQLQDVSEIARSIIERIVWATVATVGPNGRQRTRLMHPVWFWNTELTPLVEIPQGCSSKFLTL